MLISKVGLGLLGFLGRKLALAFHQGEVFSLFSLLLTFRFWWGCPLSHSDGVYHLDLPQLEPCFCQAPFNFIDDGRRFPRERKRGELVLATTCTRNGKLFGVVQVQELIERVLVASGAFTLGAITQIPENIDKSFEQELVRIEVRAKVGQAHFLHVWRCVTAEDPKEKGDELVPHIASRFDDLEQLGTNDEKLALDLPPIVSGQAFKSREHSRHEVRVMLHDDCKHGK
mmetsp:Transcript_19705/g.56318  ORF Transcript_19705/g.56318 Transcript_19705/m.56318 type:complete len:228 (-) Transcript_19705:8-691(-)